MRAWCYDTLNIHLVLRARIPVPVADSSGRVAAVPRGQSGTAFRGGEDQAARTDQRGAGIVGGQRQGWGRMSSPFRDARPFS